MTPRNLFALAVRILGLVFLYHGLRESPGIVVQIFNSSKEPNSMWYGALYFLVAIYPFFVAWWLFQGAPFLRFGAPSLVDKCYPETQEPPVA